MSALKNMVMQCLAENPESTSYSIAGRIGAPLDEVERELQHLACDGRVIETPKLGWARPATYCLTENTGVLKRACAALGGVCECAKLAIRNLGMPEDEDLGDESDMRHVRKAFHQAEEARR